jgi:hypothetical protein
MDPHVCPGVNPLHFGQLETSSHKIQRKRREGAASSRTRSSPVGTCSYVCSPLRLGARGPPDRCPRHSEQQQRHAEARLVRAELGAGAQLMLRLRLLLVRGQTLRVAELLVGSTAVNSISLRHLAHGQIARRFYTYRTALTPLVYRRRLK